MWYLTDALFASAQRRWLVGPGPHKTPLAVGRGSGGLRNGGWWPGGQKNLFVSLLRRVVSHMVWDAPVRASYRPEIPARFNTTLFLLSCSRVQSAWYCALQRRRARAAKSKMLSSRVTRELNLENGSLGFFKHIVI